METQFVLKERAAMRGDGGEEVAMGEFAGLVFVPTPCPTCGAKTEREAETMCDQTGERYCNGEFNELGIAVQPTPESIAAMDAWIDEQVRNEGIQCAIRNVRIAKNMLNAEVARTYPIGAEVAFEKRGNRLVAIVEGHGGTGRVGELRVKNPRTKKSYWITMYDVVGYVG